jgi:exonuclease III
MDLLQETDMVDPFTDFFAERPATHSRGPMQIDLISMSTSLLQCVNHAFILDPAISESDHSCIGIDFNLGNLLKRRSLRNIDPSHHQNQKLISTDVKARLKYLLELNKKQTGHNIQTQMHDLYDLCESTNQCSDTDRQRFQNIAKQMYTNAKQAEEQCKSTGSFAWSSMLAAAGLAVQGNAPTTSDTS